MLVVGRFLRVLRGFCPSCVPGAVPEQSSAPLEHGEGLFGGFKAQWGRLCCRDGAGWELWWPESAGMGGGSRASRWSKSEGCCGLETEEDDQEVGWDSRPLNHPLLCVCRHPLCRSPLSARVLPPPAGLAGSAPPPAPAAARCCPPGPCPRSSAFLCCPRVCRLRSCELAPPPAGCSPSPCQPWHLWHWGTSLHLPARGMPAERAAVPGERGLSELGRRVSALPRLGSPLEPFSERGGRFCDSLDGA